MKIAKTLHSQSIRIFQTFIEAGVNLSLEISTSTTSGNKVRNSRKKDFGTSECINANYIDELVHLEQFFNFSRSSQIIFDHKFDFSAEF